MCVSLCHFGCGVLRASMSRWANVGGTALIISWLVWHTANIPMARVELSGLRSMKWKYVSGRSASSVCVSLWVCEQGRGIWSPPNSSWQNSASLGHFLQTAIRPNQSSCSVLEYSNCTNQLHLAAPQLAKTWAVLSLASTRTHIHSSTIGSGRRSKVQSEIITLILLGLLECCQQHLTASHKSKWAQHGNGETVGDSCKSSARFWLQVEQKRAKCDNAVGVGSTALFCWAC